MMPSKQELDAKREAFFELMERRGIKPATWLRDAGIKSKNILYNYRRDGGSQKLDRETEEKLAAAYDKPVEWLYLDMATDDISTPAAAQNTCLPASIGRRGEISDHMPMYSGGLTSGVFSIGGTDFTAIPRFDAGLSAGPGSILEPNAEPLGYHLFETSWLRAITRAAPDCLITLRVDNDSMETTLFDGDWVLVDRSQRKISRPGIYGMQVGDIAWVKRLHRDVPNQKIEVISDNPKYGPPKLFREEEINLIGRVIWIVARKL